MVSYAVTLYHMILGNADSTTGQYPRGYVPLSATMIIYPPGSSVIISGHGVYAGKNSKGVTNAEVDEGDVIVDSSDLIYRVVAVNPVTHGDEFAFYVCDLKSLLELDWRVPSSGTSPISDPNFFGFESQVTGEVEFQAGFERGYFT